MESSDIYLVGFFFFFFLIIYLFYFFLFDMCLFFTNKVQTMLKQAINMWTEKVWVQIVMGCYGPKWLWAEFNQRLLFAAKIFDSQ